MAASYLGKHVEEYKGLILLGPYSTADLSDTSLRVLSIYGENDQVLNQDKYQKKDNLPEDFTEIVIKGGNHAQFGMYGLQDKDGTASIGNVEQIEITAKTISEFIND